LTQDKNRRDSELDRKVPQGSWHRFILPCVAKTVVIFHLAIEGLLRLVSGGPWCKQSAIFAAVSKAGPDRQGEILLQLLYEKASNQYWNSTPLFAQERE
jgi:hypothetical protein